MTTLELVIIALLTSQPFGPVPFTVTQVDTLYKVEVMLSPPRVLMVDEQLNIIEVDGSEVTHEQCQKESEI